MPAASKSHSPVRVTCACVEVSLSCRVTCAFCVKVSLSCSSDLRLRRSLSLLFETCTCVDVSLFCRVTCAYCIKVSLFCSSDYAESVRGDCAISSLSLSFEVTALSLIRGDCAISSLSPSFEVTASALSRPLLFEVSDRVSSLLLIRRVPPSCWLASL